MRRLLLATYLAMCQPALSQQCDMPLTKTPTGHVAVSNFNDVYETTTKNAVLKEVGQELAHPKHKGRFVGAKVAISSVRRRDIIALLGANTNMHPYEQALYEARRELVSLGLSPNYTLHSAHSIDDLLDYKEGRVWLVADILNEVVTRVDGVDNKGEGFEFTMTRHTSNNGKASLPFTFKADGSVVRACNHPVYVSVAGSPAKRYSSLLCETMHRELTPTRLQMCNALYPNSGVSTTHNIGILTEEAVVHGLYMDWLRENKRRLGISLSGMNRERARLEAHPQYQGAPIIANLAQRLGRKELIEQYQQEPQRFWERIKHLYPKIK